MCLHVVVLVWWPSGFVFFIVNIVDWKMQEKIDHDAIKAAALEIRSCPSLIVSSN